MEMVNQFVGISEKQTSTYNKDILIKDLNENDTIVVKCYCTIVAGQSISYYMDVVDKTLFEKAYDLIQLEVDKFKTQAEDIARSNNVPII